MPDYYQILNVPPGCGLDEIQAAFIRERARWKDLAVAGDENAIAQLQMLDEAFKALAAHDQGVGDSVSQATTQTEEPAKQASALAVRTAGSLALQTPVEPMAQRECPHCGASNPAQATSCLECGIQIMRPCPQCGQQVELRHNVCHRCHTVISEYDQRSFTVSAASEQRVQQERREAEARHQVLVEVQRAMARQGAVFWLFVIMACLALTVLAFVLYSLG